MEPASSVIPPAVKKSPFIALRVFLPPLRCIPHCECACHVFHEVQTPRLFRELIGTLFIGYTGSPAFVQPFKTCTDAKCNGSPALQVHFNYVFPFWFMERILTMRVNVLYPSGISLSLTTRGLTPSGGARIYHFMFNEDLDGLGELFNNRLAAPNDSFHLDGRPILYVSILYTQCEMHLLSRSRIDHHHQAHS